MVLTFMDLAARCFFLDRAAFPAARAIIFLASLGDSRSPGYDIGQSFECLGENKNASWFFAGGQVGPRGVNLIRVVHLPATAARILAGGWLGA